MSEYFGGCVAVCNCVLGRFLGLYVWLNVLAPSPVMLTCVLIRSLFLRVCSGLGDRPDAD